jgi:hypothetical protein
MDSKTSKPLTQAAIPSPSPTRQPRAAAFNNQQIDLFQTFLCNTNDEKERLSNTIELWDSIPALSRCVGDPKNQVEFTDSIPNNPDMTLRL